MRTILYKKTPIRIDAPKLDYCEGCEKKIGQVIRKLDTHHWVYKYPSKEVKKNPKLVLENTSVLCFRCHMVADCIRIINENKELAVKLTMLMKRAIS